MNVSLDIEVVNSVKVVLNCVFIKILGSNMVVIVVFNVKYKFDYVDEYLFVIIFRG